MNRREILSRAGLLAVAIAVALAAAEGIARLFDPGFQVVFRESITFSDDPLLVYELRPGARDGALRISSAGLRDDEIPFAKPPHTYRIAAIGDSLTHGSGGPRQNSYPEQLERLLGEHATGTHFEVLNLGVPGYNIEQVVERLRVRGLPFQPDAILYGYVLNDPQGFSIEAEALRTLREQMERGVQDEAHGTLGRWLAHSRLFQLARQWSLRRSSLAALRAQMPNDPAYEAARSGDRSRYFRAIHVDGEGRARLDRGMDALASLARERNLPVLVAIFPLFGTDGTTTPRALADVHHLVADSARKRGFAVLDLLPVYDAATRAFRTDMNIDFMHPDALGNRVAATAIFDWLCTSTWLPGESLDCDAPLPANAQDAAIARVVAEALARVAPPRRSGSTGR